MLDGQTFYRQWMNHWGFGDRTYGLIKDTTNQRVKLIIIHGAKPLDQYSYSTSSADAMKVEINNYLNANPSDRTDSRMNLVITYAKDHASAGDLPFYGYGLGWCFAIDYPGLDVQAAANQTTYVVGLIHELGHGLSLPHNGGLKSVNTLLGTSLMGTGNATYGRTPTYLTKADCAILNNNQVFAQDERNDWYASVLDTLKGLRAYYSNGNIIVSGRYTSSSSVPVNYVSIYHQQNVSAGDYKSSVWTTPIIDTDSFNISMPYSDFTTPGDNAYVMTIRLLHENGSIYSRSYAYTVENGVPQIDIYPAPKVKLLNLLNGAVLAKRNELTISATASDEIAVTDVQFFIDGEQKAMLIDTPYQWNWNNIAVGKHTIIAKATNTQGFVAIDSVVITVIEDSTTLVEPIADAFVRDGSFASSNFGTIPQLTVKKDPNAGFSRISYLKFDLNDYTGSVNNVKLQLSLLAGVNGTQWQIWKCDNDNWTETGVNWNNKPATTTLLGTRISKLTGVVEWDITNMVNSEINGDKILTIAVMSAVSGQSFGADFYSKEATNTFIRPKLLVNVYPGVTISQPENGDVFDIGSSTTIKANVGFTGDAPSVTFLINGQAKATVTEAPYEWNWTNLQPGTYGISVQATNSLGLTNISDSIVVRVKDTTGMIEPVADSYVRDGGSASTNFGTQTTLVVKKDVTSFNRITYLKFDLSDYKQVDAAKLRLNILSANTNVTATQWQLWKCDNDNWTETGINWNNRPTVSTLLGSISGKRTGKAEWDISSIVNAEANGDKILTLTIIGTVVGGTTDAVFHSKETAIATLRPKLIIEAQPVISLLQPVNNDTLIEKSTIVLKAKASDDKKIVDVKFFVNGEEKVVITQAPYEWSWTNNAPGVYGIRASATDNSNNLVWSDSVTVVVKDTTAPLIVSPGIVEVENETGKCGAVVNFEATASDNFSTPTISYSHAPGTFFATGTTIVTVNSTDQAGNSSSSVIIVKVLDKERPVITSCPETQIFCISPNSYYSIPPLVATDNCGIADISYKITGATVLSGNGADASGVFAPGISTITWSITDASNNINTCQTQVIVNTALSASIADVYAVNPGGNANTIYIGYGPKSLTITATPQGGTAPFTYLWSHGAITAATTVNPLEPGVFTHSVTVTDALGCTANISKTIYVVDIRCGNNNVQICHKPQSKNEKNICIIESMVIDHLAHGCRLGSCDITTSSNSSDASIDKLSLDYKKLQNELSVTVMSNPTTEYFGHIVQINSNEKVQIKIMDTQGRMVKTLNATIGTPLHFGYDMKAGTYFAQAIQGNKQQTIKLIK